MQLSHALSPAIFLPETNLQKQRQKSAKPSEPNASQYAIDEIQAYIAIRDQFLAEAEKRTTDTTLRRVCMANDFVETCLEPARSPYEAQHLPEADAVRERKRCETVKVRIAKLACIATARCDRAHAGAG